MGVVSVKLMDTTPRLQDSQDGLQFTTGWRTV
jgi:hypothetical protein